MSTVKVQYVIPVHFRIVRCHQIKMSHMIVVGERIRGDEESPFLEGEKPTM